MCSDYADDVCEPDEETIKKTASSNGTATKIGYKFKTELDSDYSLCGCGNWKVVATGEDGKKYFEKDLGCRDWEFMSWSRSVDLTLPPNSAENPSYSVAARLSSTRKQKNKHKNLDKIRR